MTENLKKFLDAVSKDDALKEKLNALGSDHDESVSGAISLAKEIGILLSKDDFEVPEGEVSILGGYVYAVWVERTKHGIDGFCAHLVHVGSFCIVAIY